MDLVEGEKAKEVEATIRSINATAEIIHSIKCRVDLKHILNKDAFSWSTVKEMEEINQVQHLDHHNHSDCKTHGDDIKDRLPLDTNLDTRLHRPHVGTISLRIEEPLLREKSPSQPLIVH